MEIFDKIRYVLIMLALLIGGAICAFFGTRTVIAFNQEPVDLFGEDVDWTELKPYTHVYANIEFMWDYYMNTTETKNGVSQGEVSRRYLVPQMEEEGEMLYMKHFLGLLVNKKDFSKAETLSSESIRWWKGTESLSELKTTPMQVEGYLRKMDKDERKFVYEYFSGSYTQSEMDEMIVPYIIMNVSVNGYYALIVIGGLMVLGGVIMLLIMIKKSREQAYSVGF